MSAVLLLGRAAVGRSVCAEAAKEKEKKDARHPRPLKLGACDPCARWPTRPRRWTHPSSAWSFRVVLESCHLQRQFATSRIRTTTIASTTNLAATNPNRPYISIPTKHSIHTNRSARPATAPTMAPKKNPAASTSAAPSSKPTNLYVVDKVWNGYWETTSHQTLVIDAFLVFLLLVGGVQFLYFLTCSHDVSKPAPTVSPFYVYICSSKLTRRRLPTALQCLPRRLYRHRWPVRPDRYVCRPRSSAVLETNCADGITVSLRMQTDPRNKTEFPGTSPER